MINHHKEVLVIEDDDFFVVQLRELLKTNYTIKSIKSINDLHSVILSDVIIILLDLNLKDTMGLDTLRMIIGKVDIPIIIITSTSDFNIAIESIKIGAQDYLVKGHFDRLMLLKSIIFAIERYQISQLESCVCELHNQVSQLKNDIKECNDDLKQQLTCQIQK